jgi:hypothetical protein
MPYLKTIACLTNSRKLSGRCVAGKEISATCQLGAWVRPVSSRPKQELQPNERRYLNANEPQLLDKIEISFEAPVPHEFFRDRSEVISEAYRIQGEKIAYKRTPANEQDQERRSLAKGR